MSDPGNEDQRHPDKTAVRQLVVVIGIFVIATVVVAIVVGTVVTG